MLPGCMKDEYGCSILGFMLPALQKKKFLVRFHKSIPNLENEMQEIFIHTK